MSALAVSSPVPFAIHASAVVVSESAVLLRGPSGSGKSALALALIAAACARGQFASLVSDDRTLLRRAGERLIVAPHPAIAGRIERRFVGIGTVAHEAEAVARLVVDLRPATMAGAAARLPAEHAGRISLHGVSLPRLAFPAGHTGAIDAILHRLEELAR